MEVGGTYCTVLKWSLYGDPFLLQLACFALKSHFHFCISASEKRTGGPAYLPAVKKITQCVVMAFLPKEGGAPKCF